MYILKNIVLTVIILFLSTSAFATDYYVNRENGNDQNNGKSKAQAWKSLFKVSKAKLKPGDVILLAKGQEFKGTIEWADVRGSKSKPIIITSYTTGNNETNRLQSYQNKWTYYYC
jgi:magnesium-transporting ATPase (P-type)